MTTLNTQRDIKKYSRALLELAKSRNCLDVVNEDMLKLQELFYNIFDKDNSTEAFKKYGQKFYMLPKIKQTALLTLIVNKFGLSTLCKNFILLLLKSNKLKILKDLCLIWDKIFYEFSGIIRVKLISAIELSMAQQDKIEKKLKEIIKDNFYIEKIIDEDILGGLIIHIKDKVYDDSLKSKLSKIQHNLRGKI